MKYYYLLLGATAMMILSCGPSKSDVELQRLKDSLRIVKQVEAELKEKASEVSDTKALATQKSEPIPRSNSSTTPEAAPVNLHLDMYGMIGGSGELHFYSDNPANSTYSYDCYGNYLTRTLKLGSYDANTGKLILKSYELGTGKYLGQFVGTLRGSKYTGIFTNTKGGKVNFSLSK